MRLINADVLMNTLQDFFYKRSEDERFTGSRGGGATWNDAIYHISIAPTVDAVQIVRCKDCQHSQRDEVYNDCWCDGRKVNPYHFCGYGKRKADMSLQTDNSDRCVCCGEPVPEGTQVCPTCIRKAET